MFAKVNPPNNLHDCEVEFYLRAAILSSSGTNFPQQLTSPVGQGMMKAPQASWVSAALPGQSRGKSALHRAGCRVTPGAGKPHGDNLLDRATETIRSREGVRVKRWCKRPPALVVIQAARQPSSGARSSRDDAPEKGRETARLPRVSGRLLEPCGNVRSREMLTHTRAVSPRRDTPAWDRMRLTDWPGATYL